MLWKIFGAVAAFIVVYLIRARFGSLGALIALALLLLGWWLLHLYTGRRLEGLYAQYQQLGADEKAQAIRELDPEIRTEFERRDANTKNC